VSRLPGDATAPRDRLRAACEALGLECSATEQDRLLAYLSLLERWNAVYNLTSIRGPSRMLTHHVVDCLAVVAPLRRHLGGAADAMVCDVGSGAGLPGVVVAVMNAGWRVRCLDRVGKKVAFVRQVAAELGLGNVDAVHARVEQARDRAHVVVSRAFATLAHFTDATRHLLMPGGVWLAMKGRTPTQELEELAPAVDVFHVEPLHPPGVDEARCLVWLRPRGPASKDGSASPPG
jgi:16S rRNA (guanine527-N7)-methyltransferase